MKRSTISLGMLLATLALASTAFAQQPAKERAARPGRSEAPADQRQAMARTMAREAMAQRLQQQIDELKAGHQELITELRAIHQAAVKEEATETAGKVEALITKRQETFQNELRRLEQQQRRLQRAGRETAVRPGRGRRGGRPAPAFELNSFAGKNIKLSDYAGKIVVLEWFNGDCPFVRYHYDQASTMIDLAKKYKDKDVVWLAINSTNTTTPQANRQFAEKHKLPYPILDDRSGAVGRQYGARNTPHMFIISKDGTIAYRGAIDNAPLGKVQGDGTKINYVDQALAELTAGKTVTTPTTTPYGCTVKYAQ